MKGLKKQTETIQNKRKLIDKDKRLKKIISIISFLNKEFKKEYDIDIQKVYFSGEMLKELKIAHQSDILNLLNSFLIKENFKKTTIRTLREDLKFLFKLKIIDKRIITFSNRLGQYKGKLCIYQVKQEAFKLINNYFSNSKFENIQLIKNEKDLLIKKNVSENVIVYIDNKFNINNNKNSYLYKKNKLKIPKEIKLKDKLKIEIKNITKETKKPNESYKNSIYNFKSYLEYLKDDYNTEDIINFYIKELKRYKNKIHFMRKNAPYETDFYKLIGKFTDRHKTKWKTIENINHSDKRFNINNIYDSANKILNGILKE